MSAESAPAAGATEGAGERKKYDKSLTSAFLIEPIANLEDLFKPANDNGPSHDAHEGDHATKHVGGHDDHGGGGHGHDAAGHAPTGNHDAKHDKPHDPHDTHTEGAGDPEHANDNNHDTPPGDHGAAAHRTAA